MLPSLRLLPQLRFFPAAALAFGLFAPGAALAQVALKDSVPHITVVGRAHVEVAPDLAILSLAVVTERPKAADAAADNAKAAQAVIDALKAQGIAAADIKTESLSLDPVYDEIADAMGRGVKRKLRGYRVRNALSVRIHAIDKAGLIAAQIIDKGANEVEGLTFTSTHEDEIAAKLDDAAMRDALRTAKAYLPAAGVGLGRVLEIVPNDQGGYEHPRIFARAMAPRAEQAALPVEPGTLRYDAEVRVTWELATPH